MNSENPLSIHLSIIPKHLSSLLYANEIQTEDMRKRSHGIQFLMLSLTLNIV